MSLILDEQFLSGFVIQSELDAYTGRLAAARERLHTPDGQPKGWRTLPCDTGEELLSAVETAARTIREEADILLVIGMFMDITPAILIFTPIFLPIATSFGMTEIQFGVMLIFNMCLGNITPPVGSVLFVGCGIGHVSIEQVTSKLIPYFVALVLALLAVTYIPALSLLLL